MDRACSGDLPGIAWLVDPTQTFSPGWGAAGASPDLVGEATEAGLGPSRRNASNIGLLPQSLWGNELISKL